MYIRRKVFSVAIDHETGEEKLFSVNEVISEESYQRMFAEAEKEEEEKPKKKLRLGDKVGIWLPKHLSTKKDREAVIEAYDQEGPRNSHKLGKQGAKYAGAAGALVGGAVGAGAGGAKGAALGAALGGLSGAANGYVGTRLGHTIRRGIENVSTSAAESSQRVADRNKVASGKMSKEDYAEKHGRKIKKNK